MEYPPQALPEVLLLSVPLLLFMHHWFLTAAGVTAVVDAVAGQTRLPCPASLSLGLCFHVGWGRPPGAGGGGSAASEVAGLAGAATASGGGNIAGDSTAGEQSLLALL